MNNITDTSSSFEQIPSDGKEEPRQGKRSKAAVTSFILGLLTPVTLFLTLLPAVIFGIAALVKIRRHKLSGAGFAKFGLIFPILLFIIFFAFWAWDMGPIENDYTVADLRLVSPECEETYSLILELLENKKEEVPIDESEKEDDKYKYYPRASTRTRNVPLGIGLDGDDYDTLKTLSRLPTNKDSNTGDYLRVAKENQEDIERIWQKAEKGRELLRQLDSFPEIADLTEPEDISSLLDKLPSHDNLRTLRKLLNAHCLLQCELDNCEQAVKDLILFDSVIWKININSRFLTYSLGTVYCISENLSIASVIATHPNCKPATFEILKEYFSHERSISFKNALIFEYLIQKASVEYLASQPEVSRLPFLIKKNSTLRLFKNYADYSLMGFGYRDISKSDLNDISRFQKVNFFNLDEDPTISQRIYSFYNPVGYQTVLVVTPALGKIKRIIEKTDKKRLLLESLLNGNLEDSPERSLIMDESKLRLYADHIRSDHEITCRCWQCNGKRMWLPVCEGWMAKNKK